MGDDAGRRLSRAERQTCHIARAGPGPGEDRVSVGSLPRVDLTEEAVRVLDGAEAESMVSVGAWDTGFEGHDQ